MWVFNSLCLISRFIFKFFYLLILILFFWADHVACGILIPQARIETWPLAVKA